MMATGYLFVEFGFENIYMYLILGMPCMIPNSEIAIWILGYGNYYFPLSLPHPPLSLSLSLARIMQ